MQYLPPTPPPPLPATERAIHEAGMAFDAGHRVPLVGLGRAAPSGDPHHARVFRRQDNLPARFLTRA